MNISANRVLVAGSRSVADELVSQLQKKNYPIEVIFEQDYNAVGAILNESGFGVVVLDLDEEGARTVVKELAEKCPDSSFVLLSGVSNEENASELLEGAQFNYVAKTGNYPVVLFKNTVLALEHQKNIHSQAAFSGQIDKINTEIKKVENIKTELIENLCHELRTPLSSIRGYTELVLKNKMGEINQKQTNALSVVLKNADKMLVLIDELSDFSKIQHYKNSSNIRKIDVIGVVSEAVAALATKSIEKNIAIDFSLASRPFFVSADFSQISYVFTTMVNEIIKTQEKNSRFGITYSHTDNDITINFTPVSVLRDNANLDSKLASFFQTTNAAESGLNVEFTLIAEIIMLHGGVVKINKDEAGDTQTITVNLPLYIEKDISYLNEGDRVKKGGRRKLIIVDDDADCIGLLSTILDSDYNVVVTNSAYSMFKALEIHKDCSLILLDINMVDLDGISICKMLKNNPEYSAIPVLMISASMQEQKKRQSLEAGALGFLEKPFEADKISSFIKNIVV
ncbi:MAG: hypothetical protein A2008_07820 [Candidatus Wallbacteria bacterium GWC2_49_35]|uniref:Response regulatory domain-containing protein n=1 Tax=Candidatus Wallbacteria bacterium GWC2_49_35 TaxID=1817813 RepID=A0A1F7WDW4_9BACT|nr:MAG: hypothetical protein A2008_07820 [Candidatus Wallbacteria bacterium GWC2_49_35]HBC74419.1 hypothetical protein [Candidatus Wallbacteria bacterium]